MTVVLKVERAQQKQQENEVSMKDVTKGKQSDASKFLQIG